jgi:hypothetical protein
MVIPARSKTLAIFFAVFSAFLTVAATLLVISQSGYASATPLCVASVNIAFWPSYVAHLDKHHLFVAFWPFFINCVGWALVGFVLGFAFRKRSHHATPNI